MIRISTNYLACKQSLTFFNFKPFYSSALIALTLIIFTSRVIAQPTKQWDKTIGGVSTDELKSVQQTADGGYILGGSSFSKAGGDKSEDSGFSYYGDYWVVKLNAAGLKEWDKTLGGIATNNFTAVCQTADGGYIVGGSSLSNAGRDKTENSRGINDYWIIKLDAAGNKLWDKTIGSPSDDLLWSLKATRDGGCILGGETQGMVGGDKSDKTKGGYDYWVVKINAAGTKEWDKVIGGSEYDILKSLEQTTDGGYILGGLSYSNASGDKSENNRGDDPNIGLGAFDYWVVKLNSLGIKEWDKTLGGNALDDFRQVIQTKDGGYIVGGESFSGISGDKSDVSKGGRDFWLVKLNATGTKEWDKTIGGTIDEYLSALHPTTDGGFVLSGTYKSLLKLNSSGNIEWDKSINGGGSFRALDQTADGGFILGTSSDRYLSGDKSEDPKGGLDYWVVKLGFSTIPPPTIQTNNLTSSNFCTSSPISVSFNTTGTFSPSEVFKVQLSNASGSFASPVIIGSGNSSPIAAILPTYLEMGLKYRVRVVSSSPAITSYDNGSNLVISSSYASPPLIISSSSTPCVGATAVYYIDQENGYTNFFWTVPSGWSIISGQGTKSIKVSVVNTNGYVIVNAKSSCGVSNQNLAYIEPSKVPNQPEEITASKMSVCAGDTIVYSTFHYEATMFDWYTWQLPPGWIIMARGGQNTIYVKAGAESGTISASVYNSCGVSPLRTLAVSSSGPPAPGVISKARCGPGTVTLTASGAPSTGSYRWYTSSSGGISIAGATAATYTTPMLMASATYYVSVFNGTCESSRVPVTATINSKPVVGATAGAASITAGSSTTLTASGANTYTWSPATGLSSTSGASVTAAPTATTTYTVTGTNASGCTSNATVTIAVTSGRLSQTISFPPIPDKIFGEPSFSLNATSSSGLQVNYKIVSGPATVSGKTLTLTGAGTVLVRASHPGNDVYLAALPVEVSFKVLTTNSTKQSQTINFALIPDKTFGDAPFTLSATASSALPVSYTILSGPATVAGNTITLTGAGTITVRATQAGNEVFAAATPQDRRFVVNQAEQSIKFANLTDKTFGNNPFNLFATATSGLPVTFSIVSGPATLAGNTLTLTGAGVITVQANQIGNLNYKEAIPVQRSFNVNKANQTVTFAAIPDKTFGDAPFNLSAVAASGLPVTFSIVSGPATVSGNTVTLTSTGQVLIRATQAGNNNYNPATAENTFAVKSPVATPSACNLALTSKTKQAESWFGMWGPTTGAGAIDLTVVAGTAPYKFIWSNNLTSEDLAVVAPGSYKVTVTDALGCSANTTVYVGQKSTPLTLSVSTQAVSVAGGQNGAVNLSVAGGVEPFKYRWSNGATTEDLTSLPAGQYTVTVTDAFGKSATISAQILDPGMLAIATAEKSGNSADMFEPEFELKVYPNPTQNQATVTIILPTQSNYELKLFDIRGAKIKTIATGKTEAEKTLAINLNLAPYAEGVYLLQLLTDKITTTKRISLRR
jgi:hypothetical protein